MFMHEKNETDPQEERPNTLTIRRRAPRARTLEKNKMSPFWRAARARLRVRMLWSMLFFRWAPKEILLWIP